MRTPRNRCSSDVLFRNTLAQTAGLASGYVFSLILAPIMLSRLGIDAFGVWAVTGAIAMYAGVADFGINRSISRFVAVYHARGDASRVAECVGIGFVAVAGVSLLAGLAAVLLAPVLSDDLGVLPADEMRTVLLASAAIYAAQSAKTVLSAIPIGMLEMVPPNVATVIGNIINFGASLAALMASTKLTVYAAANAAAEVAALAVMLVAVMRVSWPVPLRRPTLGLTKELLGYGIKQQAIWGAELVNSSTDKVIVAFFVGPAAAGAFEIGNRVAQGVRSIAVLSVSAIIPTVAAEIERSGREMIGAFYTRYLQRTIAVAAPLYVAAMVTAPFALVAWLGEAPEYSVAVLVLVSAAYLVNIYTGMSTTIAAGDDRLGIVLSNAVIECGLNIALTLALAPLFGVIGVLAGSIVAITVGSVRMIWQFQRAYAIPGRAFVAAVRGPTAAALGLGIPAAIVAILLPAPDRFACVALTIGLAGSYAAAYWLVASRSGWLPARLTAPFVRSPANAA